MVIALVGNSGTIIGFFPRSQSSPSPVFLILLFYRVNYKIICMKKIFLFTLVAIVLIIYSCSLGKNSVAGRPQFIYGTGPVDTTGDSIIYYDQEIKTKQKSYKKELRGKWTVVSMQRQQKAEMEMLSNVYIEFGSDSSFNGSASCNKIRGIYTLKGTSIKFSNIAATKMACSTLEQENAFLQLLEDRISAYSVDETKLLLRDGSSNIVFECRRS